jgi:hypothetical protein
MGREMARNIGSFIAHLLTENGIQAQIRVSGKA